MSDRRAVVQFCAVVALVLTSLLLSQVIPAQDAGIKRLTGVVSRMTNDSSVPVPGAMVVLHRIGGQATGPVDSVRASTSGRFAIDVRGATRDSGVFVLTSSHHGVAYIAMLGQYQQLDSATADILVFDTTLAAVPTTTLSRLLVLLAPAMGGDRRILEVHQIANDSSVTRVSAGPASPVWSTPLPAGARDIMLGDGEVNSRGLRVENNEVRMYTPFSPGMVDVQFSYTMPPEAFPLRTTFAPNTRELEVLLEEQGATASGGGADLADQGVMNFMGRNYYHRYLGGPMSQRGTIIITVPKGVPLSLANYLMLVVLIVGVGMLIALALAFRRRTPQLVPGRSGGVARHGAAGQAVNENDVDRIAMRIAQLDDENAGNSNSPAYLEERALLKRQLQSELAARQRKP